MKYLAQSRLILDRSRIKLSNTKPSEWAERTRIMSSEITNFPGKFSFDRTPYLREIVDLLSPDHPCKKFAVMKGAQIGFSTGVIENGIGWIISESPGPILYLTGHADLTDEAMNLKIDNMINSCGIRHLIKPNAARSKNSRTGDTNKMKEFPGGSLTAGSANHKMLRQRSTKYNFIDDFEAMKSKSKESGNTRKLIEYRSAGYADSSKTGYISTPEILQGSNIWPAYLMGDQRRYFWECPCCGARIPLEWEVPLEGEDKEMAGIYWKVDQFNKLVKGSVGYICQKCGGFFDEKHKYEMNLAGIWMPTAEPEEEDFQSYQISALYAPPGMSTWTDYVRDYISAHPPRQPRKEDEYKTFRTLCLGLPYEEMGEAPKANDLQKNCKGYQPFTVPEELSIRQGNGKIVILTCACDLNGNLEDARLDWEIVAWAESGSSYSVGHGSIGTFVPREGAKKNRADRALWSYEYYKKNSVWPEFEKVIKTVYRSESGKAFKVFCTGVDTGHVELQAFTYIDKSNCMVLGLKGDKEDAYTRFGVNVPNFKQGQKKSNLYILKVGQLKDDLAEHIKLKYDPGFDDHQPPGFLNFPEPSGGKYTYENYFIQYEAEHRVIVEDKSGQGVALRWIKKNSALQNHFFDVRIYNMAIKEIVTSLVCKSAKLKVYGWSEFCKIALKMRPKD